MTIFTKYLDSLLFFLTVLPLYVGIKYNSLHQRNEHQPGASSGFGTILVAGFLVRKITRRRRVQRTSEKEKRKKKRKEKEGGELSPPSPRHQSPASHPSPRPTRENKALAAQRRPALYTSCSSRRVAAPSCRSGGLCRLFVAVRERRPPSSGVCGGAPLRRPVHPTCIRIGRCGLSSLCLSIGFRNLRLREGLRGPLIEAGQICNFIDRHRRMISSALRRAYGARRVLSTRHIRQQGHGDTSCRGLQLLGVRALH